MGFLRSGVIQACLNAGGKNSSMKGCVNDVSKCRYNCRRNGLKEMRWNRIKRISSRMTGKDEFRDICLREWREVCERVVEMFVDMMCLIVFGVDNCPVRFVILLMKNVAKLSAVRDDRGGEGGRTKEGGKCFTEHARVRKIVNFVMIVCPFSSGDISREVREELSI